MKRRHFTPEEDALLLALVKEHGRNFNHIAQLTQDDPDRLRHRYNRLLTHERIAAHATPHITRPEETESLDKDALWSQAEQQTQRDFLRAQTERLITVALDDHRPVAIVFAADQHLTMRGATMVTRAREDAQRVAATPGMYAFLGGDGPNNHIKHHAALVNSGSRPTDEWALYDRYLSFFDDKLLGLISGNHCDWTRDLSGIDKTSELAAAHRIFYAPDEAAIKLQLGEQTYDIKIRHQFHMNSKMNLVHAVKQLWAYGNDDFDVGVLCHQHEPAVEPFFRHGRLRWGARPGSYQITSSHTRRYGFSITRPTCPTFIFWPDQHKVLGFIDIRDGADYLSYLRAKP